LVLDQANQCLWRGAQCIALTPRAYAVLGFLIARPRRLVTKDELLDNVWKGTFVTDGVLKVCVRELRKALEDDVKSPSFIETAHRRGYRFIGDLPLVDGPPAAQPTAPARGESARPLAHPIVGREATLARLEGLRREAWNGARRMVFVCGAPGIGKTSTVDALLGSPHDAHSGWIARGQCIEHYGSSEAYLPVLDALGRLLRGPARETFQRWLEQHAPTWLEPLGASRDGAVRAELDPRLLGATHERMLREMAEALEALSRQAPLTLVLEDLHWSDVSTLDLLTLLARRSEPARLLVLGTYRHGDVLRSQHPLRDVVRELDAHGLCERIELDVLTRGAVDEYLARRFPGHSLDEQFARTLYQRTDGNPLFLGSLVDLLVDERALAQTADGWRFSGDLSRVANSLPRSVRQVIELQVDRLSERERSVLEAASVVGVNFSAAAAAAPLELELTQVEELCDGLVAREQLLVSRGIGSFPAGLVSARYAFRHALQRAAVYERLPAARRMRWHARVARRGEELFGEQLDSIASELAQHFENGHEYARAVRHRLVAARADLRRHASREAAEHLVRATSSLERVVEPRRGELRRELLEELGLVRRAMGDFRGAAEAFEQLAEAAHAPSERPQRLKAMLQLASTLFWIDRERCLSVVDRALDSAELVDDALLRAHARGYCAHSILNLRGYAAEHAARVDEAVAQARASGDRRLLALHMVRGAYTHILRGEYELAAARAREGAELSQALGDGFEFLLGRFLGAWALLHAQRWSELRTLLQEADELAARNSLTLWSGLLRLVRAQLHELGGECDAAAALARQTLAEAERIDGPTGQLFFHGELALARALVGAGRDQDAAAAFARVEARLARPGAWMDWMLYFPLLEARSRWNLRRGEPERARADALELAARAEQSGELNSAVSAHATLARCALARGDVEAGALELERVAPRVAEAAFALPDWLAAAQLVVAHDSKLAHALVPRIEALRRNFEARAGADADPLYVAWHATALARLAPASPTRAQTRADSAKSPRSSRRR
jgi:DNA-binding winged helix-turn-helix (wHTH) protein